MSFIIWKKQQHWYKWIDLRFYWLKDNIFQQENEMKWKRILCKQKNVKERSFYMCVHISFLFFIFVMLQSMITINPSITPVILRFLANDKGDSKEFPWLHCKQSNEYKSFIFFFCFLRSSSIGKSIMESANPCFLNNSLLEHFYLIFVVFFQFSFSYCVRFFHFLFSFFVPSYPGQFN